VPQRRLGLHPYEGEIVVDGKDGLGGVGHLQTTIAAVSTRLPSASLSVRWLLSKLGTRTLIARRMLSGTTSDSPVRRTVPM
jgi:hypothetical protein